MRKTLLDQSHSQTITHSGFIIAVIIGFFGLIANWINFFGRGQIPILFFYAIVSLVVGLTFYMVGRIYYWTLLSNNTLIFTEESFKSSKKEYTEELLKKSSEKDPAKVACDLPDIALFYIFVVDSLKNHGLKSVQRSFAKLSTEHLLVFSLFISLIVFSISLVISVLTNVV